VLIGLGAALVAMLLNSLGALLQAAGALRATRRRPVAVQPRYLAGLGADGLAWLCSAVALRFLPVFAVQAVLGGAIALTALAAPRLFGTVLRRVDRWAVAACLTGLVLVAASAGAARLPVRSPAVDVVLLVSVLLLGVAVLVLRRGRHGWPLAVVAGLGFGGGALAVRAAHVQSGPDPAALLAQPATYLLLGFWAVGLIGYTAALSRADVASMTALLTVTEVLVPGLAGIALLGDPVRAGWMPVLGAGLGIAVAGVVVLARSPVETRRH
jgi:drug/metabolite transporter (DMT)-like permease